MPQSARFRRADRVVLGRDYARVRRQGRRVSSRNFAVSIAARDACDESSTGRIGPPGHPSCVRLGLSVSRRVGNAVVRNRVKRAIREWFRSSRDHLAENMDIVVIARRGAAMRQPSEIARELDSLLGGAQARARSGARE
ncbi:MAG: ribonuclease P protein component [bacterium]|nr:ribonuclease P protein component [bacterium]